MGVNFLGYIYNRDRSRRYRLVLEAADDKLNKHLDLLQMIEFREYTKAALSVLLNSRQQKFVKNLSLQNMKLREIPQEKQPGL